MNELASEPQTTSRASMPRRLYTALGILALQTLGNGLLGWLVIDSLNQDASHGSTPDGAGVEYLVGYVSIGLAAALLVCVVFTVRPRAWVPPLIVTFEVIAIIGGLISVFTGSVIALFGIFLAAVVIAVLRNDDVRDWYEQA